jgi:cellulose biosynthesis protein BcsQ
MNMATATGQIFSFYSFKGGVGRSMALANVAALLARAGNSVLVVDWDLEAPGLQKYFSRFDERIDDQVGKTSGIVELLSGLSDGAWPDWRETLIKVSLQGKSGTVDFDFISAGRTGPNYSNRLQKINWQELYDERHLGEFLEHLRSEWKQKYAYVLLDSRTGVTDIGDVCTVLLPDTLGALFVTNEQNLEGIQYIIDRAHHVMQKLPIDRGRLVTVPILARDEVYNEYKRAQEWRQKSADKFEPVLRDWLPKSVSVTSYFQKIFIPYVTHWSFGENLPVIENEEEVENPASISAAYARLAALMNGNLDWSALATNDNTAEIEALKAKTRLEESINREKRAVRFVIGMALAVVLSIGFSVYTALAPDSERDQAPKADQAYERDNAYERDKAYEMLLQKEREETRPRLKADQPRDDTDAATDKEYLRATLDEINRRNAIESAMQRRYLYEQMQAADKARQQAEAAAAAAAAEASNKVAAEVQAQNSELLRKIDELLASKANAPISAEKSPK